MLAYSHFFHEGTIMKAEALFLKTGHQLAQLHGVLLTGIETRSKILVDMIKGRALVSCL